MKIIVPKLPANGNFSRDSAYPAKRPQNSEIAVAASEIIIVFSIQVLNRVSVSRSLMCTRVGFEVQNGA